MSSQRSTNRSDVLVPPAEIFKAYDIRGVVGDSFTPAIVESIGRAIGSEARARGSRRFAIGRDGRLSGPELAQALARGLVQAGCDVLDIGQAPTPGLYFADVTLTDTGSSTPDIVKTWSDRLPCESSVRPTSSP